LGTSLSSHNPLPAFRVAAAAKGIILNRESIVRMAENGTEAAIPLSGAAMAPFAQAIAMEFAKVYTGGSGGSGGNGGSGNILQVGTLIGDERSYKELERVLRKFRLGEDARGVK